MSTAPQNAPGTELTSQQALTVRLASKLYQLLELPSESSGDLIHSMVASLFATKAEVTDAQVQSFLIVAAAHRLNPWLKEIYAFAGPGGGIVPIVGVDGWVRIITSHPQYDGHEFLYNGDPKPPANPSLITSITCLLYRKDRNRPTQVTEFMTECKGSSPAWNKTASRMLRHRALMQAGRYAFGLGGIHTEDDAEIIAGNAGPVTATDPATGEITELMPSAKKPATPTPAHREAHDVVDVQATTRAETVSPPPPPAAPPPPPPVDAAAPAQATIDGVAEGATLTAGNELATQLQKDQLSKRAALCGSTLDACLKAKGFELDGLTLVQAGVLKTFMMSGQAPKVEQSGAAA